MFLPLPPFSLTHTAVANGQRLTVVLQENDNVDEAKVRGDGNLKGQLVGEEAADQIRQVARTPLGDKDEREAVDRGPHIVFVDLTGVSEQRVR